MNNNIYNPSSFNELINQEDLINILKILINIENLNILFIGNSGCGKTLLLNLLIKEYYGNINKEIYEQNILHINSLKEQGISYYRNDVKIFCQTKSTIKNKKKIIVLDDIDLINEQSQQIFRNFIDKYSHNVHFLASCINNQKVIETLQSRLFILKIKSLEKENLRKILNIIKEKENIIIETNAEDFILNVVSNNVKILINYLYKFKLINEPITYDLALNLCTNICFSNYEDYINYLKNGKLNEGIELFYDLYDKGYSVIDILDNFFLFVKNTNLLNEEQKYSSIPLICKYITIFYNIHEEQIELALFTNNLFKILYFE